MNASRNIFYFLFRLALIASPFSGYSETSYEKVAASQASANTQPGVRHVPERDIPVPKTGVSLQEQMLISAPYTPAFNIHPKNPEEWKVLINDVSTNWITELSALKNKMAVTVTPTTIAGVKAFVIEPLKIPEKNKNRLLVHVHGGGYVFGAGEAGIDEAVLMAGFGGFKIISVDYRMPPDFPYPAALDDVMTVWKEVTKTNDPKSMAIFGTSTGGGLTLAMVLRAKDENLPLPAAIAPSTPWSDLNDIGDSYKTNEWLDNILVTWNGWLGDAAKLYAGSYSLKDPYLSPVYGDFHDFPPTILTSGTRDLFLSNTVRVHRKLRRTGIEADLNIYEGQSHADFLNNPDSPETQEVFREISNFFDKHLRK